MPKEAKIFRFGKGGIPKGLEKRIKIPSHIKREGHPLKPYVDESIIPSDLDLIVLEDLDSLYRKFSNSDFFTLSVGGMYIAENHIWTDNEVYERMNQLLEEEYGIHTKRALLLPQQISYWSMIYEGLHDVFNNLPQDKRKKIISSAVKNYDNIDKLSDMLELTHLDISSFKWDIGEIGRRMEKNKKEKKARLTVLKIFTH